MRITAYVVARSAEEADILEPSHFSQLTDMILMGAASFDTEGRVNLCGDFAQLVERIKALTDGPDVNCYLNILGPGATEGTTFQEQMYSQGERHRAAFESGQLEDNIKNVLDGYGLDGVAFDYEFPLEDIHKQAFGDFLISLDSKLGDGYKICAALSGWNAGLPKDVIKVIDKIDAEGLVTDENTGLTASFNTPEVIYQKTQWVIRNGYGGVMVWNYANDVPADNDASLFNHIAQAKQNALAGRIF